MPTKQTLTDICNLALLRINQRPIETLNDDNKLARTCKAWLTPSRQELLRACDWTFARKTFALNLIGESVGLATFPDWALAQDTDDDTNAVFPWAYIYAYPPKVLFVHKVYNINTPVGNEMWAGYDQAVQFATWLEKQRAGWELLRSKKTDEYAVACNIKNAIIKYTADIDDSSQFDPTFVIALALQLASNICLSLSGDKELKQEIDGELEAKRTEAFRQNLSENPERGPASSPYEDVRGM